MFSYSIKGASLPLTICHTSHEPYFCQHDPYLQHEEIQILLDKFKKIYFINLVL